jgi:hypothetical protein
MITNFQFINPLTRNSTAFETAQFLYALKGNGNFYTDLANYHQYGVVISRSDVFAMARVIEWKGDRAWFCQMAVGDLADLLKQVPYHLDKILFCRRSDGRLREYSLDKLIQKVNELKGRKCIKNPAG